MSTTKKHPDIQMLGEIVETIFITLDGVDSDYWDTFLDELVNFTIDQQGRVRKAEGMISYDEVTDNDMEYVPRNRYETQRSPWNSHSYYVEITLPNPMDSYEHYKFIRDKMGAELIHRLHTLSRHDAEETEGY